MLCKICQMTFASKHVFLKHVSCLHKFSNEFTCPSTSCCSKFHLYSSFRKHTLSCNKPDATKSSESNHSVDQQNNNSNATCSKVTDTDFVENNSCIEVSEMEMPVSKNVCDFNSSYLGFMLQLYQNPRVTRSLVQNFVENVSDLFDNYIKHVTNQIAGCVENLNDEDKATVWKALQKPEIFEQFGTEHKRLSYLKQKDFLIMPNSYLISEILDDSHRSNDCVLTVKRCEGQYIKIRNVLKQFLMIPNVYNKIKNYIENENSSPCHSSIFTGQLWKSIISNTELYKNKVVLPMFIYFDDYETCNPLGSHATVHKLGAVYFSLPCIPPALSKQLSNIFLFGLFHSSDREKSNSEAFKPFIDELLYISQEGITINIGDREENPIQIYVVAPLILGDNLGLNSIMGFNASFNSNYFCRICISDKLSTQTMCLEDTNLLRKNHRYEVNQFGIKELCVFDKLPYFQCITNQSCDIMHDIFEGICRYCMARILKNFICEKKYFSIVHLNNRIKYFDYCDGIDVGNRVPSINFRHIENGSLIMSSSEMHAFVAYFALMVGDLIDSSDEVWQFYLMLCNIVEFVMKSSFYEEELKYFQILIAQFNHCYIQLFHCTLPPKFHFMVHYPTIIRSIGPLTHVSSIRFEAFHRIAKTNAHIVTSRINIPYTLSMKHQLVLANKFALKKGLTNKIRVGPAVCLLNTLNLQLPLNSDNYVVVNWIRCNNSQFKPGIYTQIPTTEGYELCFAKIKFVVYSSTNTTGDEIFLIFNETSTYGFDKHFNGYMKLSESSDETNYRIINALNTIPCKPHRAGNGHMYVSCACINI